jgi:dihydroorotate dehydrogenase
MTNQPDPNPDASKREIPPAPAAGGTSYVVYGSVGPGANIGSGSVTADQIAGNDIVINGMNIDNQGQKFADLLNDLKDMLLKAREAGEIPVEKAQEVIEQIESARELVEQEKKPSKETLIQKLQRVMEVIDDVLENVSESKSPAAILIKALPFAALLIKLAAQIF